MDSFENRSWKHYWRSPFNIPSFWNCFDWQEFLGYLKCPPYADGIIRVGNNVWLWTQRLPVNLKCYVTVDLSIISVIHFLANTSAVISTSLETRFCLYSLKPVSDLIWTVTFSVYISEQKLLIPGNSFLLTFSIIYSTKGLKRSENSTEIQNKKSGNKNHMFISKCEQSLAKWFSTLTILHTCNKLIEKYPTHYILSHTENGSSHCKTWRQKRQTCK